LLSIDAEPFCTYTALRVRGKGTEFSSFVEAPVKTYKEVAAGGCASGASAK
jgi:hypothetical protein